MKFSLFRQTMTDDAYSIMYALVQSSPASLLTVHHLTGLGEHAIGFILEQMAVKGIATEQDGLWQLTDSAGVHNPVKLTV